MFSFRWKRSRLYPGLVLPPTSWWSPIAMEQKASGVQKSFQVGFFAADFGSWVDFLELFLAEGPNCKSSLFRSFMGCEITNLQISTKGWGNVLAATTKENIIVWVKEIFLVAGRYCLNNYGLLSKPRVSWLLFFFIWDASLHIHALFCFVFPLH